jgi:hypothetical protein
MICPYCGRPFGYTIDGVFYPVVWHIHKTADGKKLKFRAVKNVPQQHPVESK